MVGEIVADEEAVKDMEGQPGLHGITESTFLYTHKNFTIAYNGDRIIEVNMTSEGAVPVQTDRSYELTYSVQYVYTRGLPTRSHARLL
jgi:hypothetical protein